LLVPKYDTWHFELVEPQSSLFKVAESPEVFVLIDGKNWIDSIVMLKGIFDKAFSVF
jgi:hypothetical protein